MNRARDYINFAVKFVGLGYIVLWPVSVIGTSGNVFGAAVLCGGRLGAAMDHLCQLPHLLRLNPGLHIVGAVSAALAVLHLAAAAVRSRRPPGDPGAAAKPAGSVAAVKPKTPRFRFRPLPPPRKLGRPRKEFGLRGVPR
jgi:hypothetical protein